ncbi:hypothetical protein BO99DRAFT_434360 [Aspergillus violaceofuscus CBS 115571]|uniref:Uncharacterized protein n=1 Tax=Aspergillus violaceofuscus (strain CBS 115571) TaxID=1450538 RepID=A0A2V5H7J4_ASPV1|nr:hypothetical protein BO99DRAFT_434360 [Aspergillus violaceofuscus CBS 115571]
MDAIRSVVQQRGFSSLDEQPSSAAGYMRCSLCEVEFQISLEDCGKDGKAVIITKWLDLGAVMDLEDPKWKKKATFDPSGPRGGLDLTMASSGESYDHHPSSEYILYAYAEKASRDLSIARGQGLTREKNKKTCRPTNTTLRTEQSPPNTPPTLMPLALLSEQPYNHHPPSKNIPDTAH